MSSDFKGRSGSRPNTEWPKGGARIQERGAGLIELESFSTGLELSGPVLFFDFCSRTVRTGLYNSYVSVTTTLVSQQRF